MRFSRQAVKASGGLQPRIEEGASHHARRGKDAEAFLINEIYGMPLDSIVC